MRMRRKAWVRPELEKCNFFINNTMEFKDNWHNKFHNKNPIHLELGCGKGTYISKLAVCNKNINYIAIDIKSEVLGNTKRNIDAIYEENNQKTDNIFIMSHDISRINLMLSKEDVIDRIYINFCNPWNKPLQYKKRLTHPKQLIQYKSFLRVGGEIHFKTDNDELFNHSINYLEENGFTIKYITTDLINSGYDNDISTEHQDKFVSLGIPIKFLIAVNNSQGDN